MNRIQQQIVTIVALGIGLGFAATAQAEVAVGDPAPDFELISTTGEKVALRSFKGKRLILEWINPNCPFSVRHAEKKTMQGISDRHSEVAFLAINSTTTSHRDYMKPEDHLEYQKKHGIKYPVLYDSDGKIGRAYGAKTTPHMYVIDENGKIAYQGAIDDDPRGTGAKVNYVEQALQALAEGRRPDPASTKPYGCSVKY